MFNWRPVYDSEQRTSQLRRENARLAAIESRLARFEREHLSGSNPLFSTGDSSQLRHVQTSPWYIRFFRPEFVHYDRLLNPITVVDGAVGDLQHPLDHYPFSKGFSHRFARHNSYSSFEAQQILQNRAFKEPFSMSAAFFERDFNRRRFHQKELSYRLPARPLIKFLLL
jgi:hypothetical protein